MHADTHAMGRMVLGLVFGALLAAVPVLQQQLADLAPAGACQLLLVLARLQHRPSPAFMEQLLSRPSTAGIAHASTRQWLQL